MCRRRIIGEIGIPFLLPWDQRAISHEQDSHTFFRTAPCVAVSPPLFSSALCRAAVAILLVLLLSPLAWKVLLFLKMVLAAAKVVFFPYSMVGSREDFKLG